MARMIDADAMLAELMPITYEMEHTSVLVSDMSKIMRKWVERQPTLTPPNEPLTCKELKEMAGKPVYVVDPKKSISSWMLIDVVDEKSIWCVMAIGSTYRGFHKTYGKTWIAYRRPPEGENNVIEVTEDL